jgi:hypothetical protein
MVHRFFATALAALAFAWGGYAFAADTIPHNEAVAATAPVNGCMYFDQGTSGGTDTKLCAANAAAWATAYGFGALTTTTPGAGIATFLTTPSSANLASALTDETGSGAAVFGTSPTIAGSPIFNLGSDAAGDLWYRAASTGIMTRLPIGTNGQVLTVSSGLLPAWSTTAGGSGTVNSGLSGNVGYYATSTNAISASTGLALSSTQLTSAIIGLGSDATGDIYYRAASTGALTRLGIGSTGNVLTVAGGLPSWAVPAAASVATAISAAGTTQGTATVLATDWAEVSTVGSGEGVVQSTPVAGKSQLVANNSATTLLVYPVSGGTFDSLSANVAVSVGAGGRVRLYCFSTTHCDTK